MKILSIQASCHLGHQKFSGAGKQCLAIAVCAVNYIYKLNPSEWNQSTLDSILNEGDNLYKIISAKGVKYPTTEDIPYNVARFKEPLHGILSTDVTSEPNFQLEDAIEYVTKCQNYAGCIFHHW